jgi:TonB dependent receptor/Carboxypeptidase regulatory-like domain/TonB-dependent Receptor Plug Domain
MTRFKLLALAALLTMTSAVFANIFGAIRGVVHDPQHRPIQDAMVMLKAKSSDWSKSVTTDATGEFQFNAVPLGDYSVSVASQGFAQTSREVTVVSGTVPVVHFLLTVATANANVTVSGAPEVAPTDSATPTTLVSRLDIERTPGADRTNSLAMITDNVPGAYVTHDQLHIRGGHQATWLVDGVPVPNTNIASNIGPQFDPKDIDYLEVNRGSYGAEFGDRTYGVFNVVPRTGFERNNQAEFVVSAGSFYQTNDSFSFGSHTERFAYYVGLNGNRSNLGIQTPIPQVGHDAANGFGGFGSFIFNVDPSNQLRLVTALRKDYYQVPYDPNFNDLESSLCPQCDSSGLHDSDHEADALINASWVHTFNSKLLLTVSPLFHRNTTDYQSAPNDYPTATSDHHTSTYAGGQVSFGANFNRNDLQVGFFGFHQTDDQRLGILFNCPTNGDPNFPDCKPSQTPFADRETPSGGLAAFFLDEKFKPFSWLTFSAGMRPTHFAGSGISESAISPRFGAAVAVPRLRWTFRAFYGHYYQAPPLLTASGPLSDLCTASGCKFIPLHGERDEEHQFGVTIPFCGWTLDADTFRTRAHNFFDHNALGESNLFLPLTIDKALIRGWELTVRSPRIAHRAQLHLAYSNQVAYGGGAITGGLTDFADLCPPGVSLCALDHDQRNTLNIGADVSLPWNSYASSSVYYGSGFKNAFTGHPYPGGYLPGHTTFDLSLGKDFGDRLSASLNALNVANRRIELDNSQTFGGFHWNNPREIFVELRYRFHY